jgi:hypothetical protein
VVIVCPELACGELAELSKGFADFFDRMLFRNTRKNAPKCFRKERMMGQFASKTAEPR